MTIFILPNKTILITLLSTTRLPPEDRAMYVEIQLIDKDYQLLKGIEAITQAILPSSLSQIILPTHPAVGDTSRFYFF